ncbi:MAG: SUMF1/EgtB/PvdO family nonheme iron enzyme, partial [Planctomycetia bacterium]|nr:SUMF1/EgtB/PvdO family nonheme iron enzyme [Planctomycetia bacterium]
TNTYYDGVVDPLCKSGSNRIFRGGSWINVAARCRSAYRGNCDPTYRYDGLGVRLVIRPVASPPPFQSRGSGPTTESDVSTIPAVSDVPTKPETLDVPTTETVPLTSEPPKTLVNGSGMKFHLISPGRFAMGSPLTGADVLERYPTEGQESWFEDAPKHEVTLSEPFYIAECEVTVGEFRRFVDSTNYRTTAEEKGDAWGYGEDGVIGEIAGLSWWSPGFHQDDTHPVVCVSWNDAQKYIEWMNVQYRQELDLQPGPGWAYSLPTEAQWEYACRAGTTTEFFWGNDADAGNGYLNAAGQEGSPRGQSWKGGFRFMDGCLMTSPVKSFRPNPWGLYDIHGNVLEWCSDWYGDYPYDRVTDPEGPSSGSKRVIRGGGWDHDVAGCRSAFRDGDVPSYRSNDLGLRLAIRPIREVRNPR